ncbi:stress response translation initiation inhibitor YciH [Colwellia sp. RSH04]|nr:stress response translation initiation inhibitor YciH [Colwellia sp. RSH04]RHW75637.1 stress response translation initiation inhibitor YciH [Colwellia sp. RSH04]
MKEKLTSLSDLASVFGKNTITTPTNETSSSHDENLVYSTDSGRIKPNKSNENVTSSDGYAKVRRETKGRKGKGVVTITGLGLDNNALKTLAKKLKKTCGTGGTVIEEVIEIQGDKRDEIKAVLEKEGFKVKFIGG